MPFEVLRTSSEACEMSRSASTRVLRRSRYCALMPVLGQAAVSAFKFTPFHEAPSMH